MKVKELIEKLKTYPSGYDVTVWIEGEVLEDFEYPVKGIYQEREDSETVDLII